MPSGIYARNKHTRLPRSRSGMKGVLYTPTTMNRKRERVPWKAYIRKNGWYLCIGYFATKEEAAGAYNREAIRVYGPETFLNPV